MNVETVQITVFNITLSMDEHFLLLRKLSEIQDFINYKDGPLELADYIENLTNKLSEY